MVDADEAVGFNAEDVDREIIASRLKEGVVCIPPPYIQVGTNNG